MQKTLIFVAIFLAFTTNIFAYQNEPDGFRSMKWGTSFNEFKNMKLKESANGFKTYTKTNDELKIGDVPLKFIEYDFWNNKFQGVTIRVANGDSNFRQIVKMFKIKFGNIGDYKPTGSGDAWIGDITSIWVTYMQLVNYTEIRMISRKVLNEKLAFERNKKEGIAVKAEKVRQEIENAENERAKKNASKGL